MLLAMTAILCCLCEMSVNWIVDRNISSGARLLHQPIWIQLICQLGLHVVCIAVLVKRYWTRVVNAFEHKEALDECTDVRYMHTVPVVDIVTKCSAI